MKPTKDYLETSLWYKEPITDPNQVFAEFFTAAALKDYRKRIKSVLIAAFGKRIWRKENPGALLYYFKLIESVINAAWLINKENKTSPLVIRIEDSFNPNLFCSWQADSTQFDFFPRFLSFKEYVNPYIVFKRFFKYLALPAWKVELQDLLEYALVETSLPEAGENKDMLSLYFHLSKLIEAAHLIDVRENNHIGGNPKNRIKTTS
ncbi:hypothetical protein A4D02_33655 [Niastella koreensis]|uniref:Uncharacterized protein n=2 Tax=Niastella koreensis TaxID=354356 RepID=G8TAH8_NIAKG|nr:hypothetical protein [Niastella koreensis]AEV98140.1 hypothetical protein Niako_1777 [Niastella koreensis GR20-10]OQP45346.1 hypothetical protein A4D02_33655 [Niastella koreensis]